MITDNYIESLWALLEWDKNILIIFDQNFNLVKAKSSFSLTTNFKNKFVDELFSTNTTRKISTIFNSLKKDNFQIKFECQVSEQSQAFPCHAFLHESPDGEKYFILASTSDTIVSTNEITHQEYEEHFRMIFQNSPDGIFIMDGKKILDCNPAAEKLYGYSKEEILNRAPYQLSPEKQPNGENSKKLAMNYIKTAVKGTPLKFEWVHQTSSGDEFDAEITLTPVQINNKPIIQAIIRDISIRKKNDLIQKAILEIGEAANETESLENLYKTIHNVVSNLMVAENLYIALYDEKSDLISFPYFADKYDEKPEPRRPSKGFTEYVLQKEETVLLSPEQVDNLYDDGVVNLLGSESIDWLGVPLKVKGKTIGVMAVQSYDTDKRYTTSDANILAFVSTQIASVINRKQYEDKILESQEKLKDMNASKDRLFSIIAHDLKSPFTALLGFSELMAVEAEMLTRDEVKSYSESINKVAKNVHNLLENLLHWSRFQTGRFSLKTEEIEMKPLIREVITLFANNAKTKNIELTYNAKNDAKAFGDIGMVQSTLRNLVSNAIKFTKENGKVVVSTSRDKKFLYVSVKDNGIGIKKADTSKIFRIDLQHTTTGTSNEKGTGLGLLLSKEMIEKNGGEIRVESKRGKGSEFIFSLPLQNPTDNQNES